MGSVLVVVAEIIGHESFHMPRNEHNYMVQQVATAAPHPTLRDSILTRTAKRGANPFSTQGLGRADHVLSEL